MSLNYILDVCLHLETFRNVDLHQQGVYFLKFKIYLDDAADGSGHGRTCAAPISVDGFNFGQVSSCNKEDREACDKRKKTRAHRHNVLPATVLCDDSGNEFHSRHFVLVYSEEEIELNDICVFRIEFPVSEMRKTKVAKGTNTASDFNEFSAISDSIWLEADLMHAPLKDKFESWKNEPYDPSLSEYKMIGRRMFKVNSILQGVHEYVPVAFDDNFSIINLMLHCAVVDVRTRQRPWPASTTNAHNSGGLASSSKRRPRPRAANSNGVVTLASVLFESCDVIPQGVCAVEAAQPVLQEILSNLIRSHTRLSSAFARMTGLCITGGCRNILEDVIIVNQLHIPGSKEGRVPPSLRDRIQSELADDPVAIADLAYRDISAISAQIMDIWHRFVTTAPASAREYCCLLRADYERKVVDRYSANLVRETKVGSDLSDPQEDDAHNKERFVVAKQLRDSLRIDGGYQGVGLANLAVEPAVGTQDGMELSSKGTWRVNKHAVQQAPVIFEQRYISPHDPCPPPSVASDVDQYNLIPSSPPSFWEKP